MAEQRRDFDLAQARRDRALDDAAEPLVVEAFEDVGDQARRAGADARAFAGRGLEEAAGRAGDVDVAHPPRDHRRDQEILLEEIGERLADPVLVARDDRGVRDRQAERMAEQRGDREPVGEAADHRRLGEGVDVAEPRIVRLERAGGDEHAAITTSRPVATTFMPCAPGCAGLKRARAPLVIGLMPAQ